MPPPISLPQNRISSIDILRGLVMVIMALDHTRDYFTNVSFDPLDLTQTSPALFLTRWITHFCAPVFVFLAGTSAFLSLSKRKHKEAAWILFTRGLWLIIVELVIINWSWTFEINFSNYFVQVIWAIGCSMIVLSALVFLKPMYVGIIGLLIIFSHNLLDGVTSSDFGSFGFVWKILHEKGFIPMGNNGGLFVAYPILPWIGTMAAGFAFGQLYRFPFEQRIKSLLILGASCFGVFLILRGFNIYGDPNQWSVQNTWWKTIFNFVDCRKYPPSLLYLLMTIGPAFWVLAILEKINNKATDFFKVFGSVPFFYYLLHVPLIHLLAVATAYFGNYSSFSLFGQNLFAPNPNWGFHLGIVYLVWVIVVAILYYPSRWFMKIKKKQKNWWLSYL
jgi:uncharacterized membrane protein